MAARLATDDGITAYRQRGRIAETPHGDIKHNMRFGQLSLRGKRKAAAEWKFTCAVRNLRTAISSGHLTRHALDTLDALDRETSRLRHRLESPAPGRRPRDTRRTQAASRTAVRCARLMPSRTARRHRDSARDRLKRRRTALIDGCPGGQTGLTAGNREEP